MSKITGPHDPERTLAKPLYEAGLALWRAREARTEPRLRRMEPDALDMTTGTFALVCADAAVVIAVLKSHGWLTEGYFTAAKAERDGK